MTVLSPRPASHTVTLGARVGVTVLFDTVTAEDVLPRVLQRFGPVPGVRGTTDLTGSWTAPGTSRTILLDDGHRAVETLTGFERPNRFEYRVDSFTGIFGRSVEHAEGVWTFDGDEHTATLTWQYRFFPRPATGTLLTVFVRTFWAGYMRRAAERCVELAQTGGASGAASAGSR